MRLSLDSCRLLPGISGGLTERTALVDIAIAGALKLDDARVRAAATTFCPEEHFYDVAENDWPTAFLAREPGADGPTRGLGEWLVALTVAAQRWGHDPVFRGRVLAAEPDRLRLAIPWQREEPFRAALDLALALLAAWLCDTPDRAAVRALDRDFRARLQHIQAGGLNVDSLRFAETAARRGIPFEVTGGMVRYGWGANAEYLDGTVTGDTGVLAAATARNKAAANRLLGAAGVPVPRCRLVSSRAEAADAAAELGWPVVVKPPGLDSGVGVEPGITDHARLERACGTAARLGGRGTALIEDHIDGLCYRLLVVHGRMLAAVRRVPAGVTGDGRRSVADLVAQANTDPRRTQMLHRIVIDPEALTYLAEQGLRPDSVPDDGRRVWLRRTAYSETGGHHEDVTAVVHPDNRALAERIARLVRLDIAGIDLISTDITRSWRDNGAAVCEVNAQPSLMPHWIAEPDRDINGEVFDILFAGRPPRIPTAAVTGPGAGRVAVLLHRILSAAGWVTGLCADGRVQIGDDVLDAGTTTVLAEPGVQAAVFALPAEVLAADGHPCDRYDVVADLDDGEPPAPVAAGMARPLGVDDAAIAAGLAGID